MIAEDIIECKSWMNLGYPIFEEGNSLPYSKIVYVNIEHIPAFFKLCEKSPNEYVVISGYSDFGPCLQYDYPVHGDLLKWIQFQNLSDLGYRGITVEGRCNKERCKLSDKYSIKCWSFTYATFPEIPSNIKRWFCVNNNIKDDRIQSIPLGIGEKQAEKIINFLNNTSLPKTRKQLYINFENYNMERVWFKSYFKGLNNENITVIDDAKLTLEQYWSDMMSHDLIFCPYGNGLDTYRFLESIYLGAIPIVLSSNLYNSWSEFSCFGIINSIADININEPFLCKDLRDKFIEYGLEKILRDKKKLGSLSYWKEQIKNASI